MEPASATTAGRGAFGGRLAGLGLAGVAVTLCGCAPQVSRSELASKIAEGTPPGILDVRSQGEYDEAHVPGAVHIPFYAVIARRDELPKREGEPLVVYCEHGPRAGLARAGLWLAGAGEIRFLEGHMSAWKFDGYPVESAERGQSGESP